MTHPHVAVGVDGSMAAVRALDRAADEAARRGAELHIVYAVADRDEAGPVLASSVSRVRERHPGLEVSAKAAEGSAARALVRESESAALTVVGNRGLGGITGLLFGSVSLRLAAHTRGPLLVVRGDHPCRDGEVLLGLADGADADVAAYAFQEAERRGARLRVLHSRARRHVTPELPSLVPATSPGQRERARQDRAEEAVPRFTVAQLREKYPEIAIEARTVSAGPARALLEASREASAVVIGTHRRRANGPGPSLGPVALTLLHRSHCPVVVVPTG